MGETRRMPKRDKAFFIYYPETGARRRDTHEQTKDGVSANLKQRILAKSLPKPATKIGNYGRFTKILYWRIQDQCIDVGIVHVINDENSHPSWTELYRELVNTQERELRGHSKFIQYHSEVDRKSSRRDSEYETFRKHGSIVYEIYIVSWSSDQVDRSKSTCSLRFRCELGKNFRSFRSKSKMRRPNGRISIEYFLLRITGNRWRNNFVRVKYFSQDSPHCRFFKRSRMICKNARWNQKNSKIELSSCQWSRTLNGQEKGTKTFVFQIQKKSKRTRKDSRKDTGRSSVPEMKRSGFVAAATNLKENGNPSLLRWCNDSKKNVIQCLRVPALWAVEFWEGQKKKRPYTSMRMLRTQSFYCELFTQQISAASTEQLQAGSQEDWVPRYAKNGLRRAREGPEPVCVQTPFSVTVWHTPEEKGEQDVLPWYRLVGVASASSESQRRENLAARKGKWSPRGTGTTVLTYPCKAGENGQYSGVVGGSSPWTRPSAPVCGDTSNI